MLGYFFHALPGSIKIGKYKWDIQNPKPYYWNRPFRKPLEIYRCDVDRLLLTDNLISKGLCAGHHIKQPAVPTIFELILIYLGIIR